MLNFELNCNFFKWLLAKMDFFSYDLLDIALLIVQRINSYLQGYLCKSFNFLKKNILFYLL